MAERLDALVARKYTDRDGNEKTSWTKIGAAFPTQNGGYSVSLEALPLPTMGDRGLETRIVLMVPKPKEDQQQSRQDNGNRTSSYDRDDNRTHGGAGGAGASGYGRDLDDEIPFSMSWK